jgi:cytochrome c oxidase cbb3-type subunit II
MSAVFNWTLGTDPVWKARYRVTCACVHAKSWDGFVRQAYRGACLDRLAEEQAAHFLRMGLVERIPDDEQPAIAADAPVEPVDLEADEDTQDVPDDANTDIVDECLADLDRLGVQSDAGAPTARKALRESGRHYGNDTIALAVRARKSLSGTAS